MNVAQVAQNAVETFKETREKFGYTKREHAALIGFLRGVAVGSITIGQSWPVKFLIAERAVRDTHVTIANNLSDKECKLLEDMFASGMFCDGQVLNIKQTRKVAGVTIA